jgi:hypothetical protein
VAPDPVRAPHLRVNEAAPRLPDLDAREPVDTQPVQPEPVLDQRPGPHRDRPERHHPEAEPGRRDRLEVERVGEEREHFAARAGQELIAFQYVDHRPRIFMAAHGGLR